MWQCLLLAISLKPILTKFVNVISFNRYQPAISNYSKLSVVLAEHFALAPEYHKVSELLLHEYRSGKIGLLSLETPAMAEVEKEEVARKLAEKELIKQQKIEQEKLKRSGKRYND